MTDIPFNIDELREDIDTEVKLAAGRDGKGALPSDFWETYSAFANTDGGVILLGVSEKEDGVFEVVGVEEPDRVVQPLWNLLNNPQKVSRNLLTDASVKRYPTGSGRWVIEIEVPSVAERAPRLHQRQPADRHVQMPALRRLSLPRGRGPENDRRAG